MDIYKILSIIVALIVIGTFIYTQIKFKIMNDIAIKDLKDTHDKFAEETNRQIKACWLKLDKEIPDYFREIKEMYSDNQNEFKDLKARFEERTSSMLYDLQRLMDKVFNVLK